MDKISKKKAVQTLLATLEERKAQGLLLEGSEDYFEGSCDRWSKVITQIANNIIEDKGRILDIGPWDGVFCSALIKLGFSASAIDWVMNGEKESDPPMGKATWQQLGIEWRFCQIEADPIPFPDNSFVGVYMGQVLEHFTYSPRGPMEEIKRVLKPGGILIIDVPNVGEWHNFYRLLRGKNILYDYKKHYIDTDEEPVIYKGLPYFKRHNREFTPNDLRVLAETCGFEVVDVKYERSIRHGKKGGRRLEVPFSALRDLIPLFRKCVMLTARKPV